MLGKGFLRFVGADVWGNNAKLSVRKRVLRGSFERMFGGNNAKLSVRKSVLRGSFERMFGGNNAILSVRKRVLKVRWSGCWGK